jgi:Fic family protein
MKNILDALKLKKNLDLLRPISPEREAKIIQKFRLDWNYHSNNLEGNSLNFGETTLYILHGLTSQGKPLKDYLEIKGHDEAIKIIEDVVKEKRPLTENFIRELHTLILKEPYEVDALTSDGKPTKKLIQIGKYKTSQNHVKTRTGEIFYFAEPFEVEAKMSDLISWYEKESKKNDVNAIILAATFHYKFVRIHPFDDGNGRLARLLMNFILMQFDFPPVIIKTEDKENYFFALQNADSGLIENFIDYIAKNLIQSLQIVIAGANGEEIEDREDVDKKIILLANKIKNSDQSIKITRSSEKILDIFNNSILKLWQRLHLDCKKFEDFYLEKRIIVFHVNSRIYNFEEIDLAIQNLKNYTDQNIDSICLGGAHFSIAYNYNYLNKEGLENFYWRVDMSYKFGLEKYTINLPLSRQLIEKNYDENLDNNDIEKITRIEKDKHYKAIEEKYNDKK